MTNRVALLVSVLVLAPSCARPELTGLGVASSALGTVAIRNSIDSSGLGTGAAIGLGMVVGGLGLMILGAVLDPQPASATPRAAGR